jgi:hypothetical protein
MKLLKKASIAVFVAGVFGATSSVAGGMYGHARYPERGSGGWGLRVNGGGGVPVYVPGIGTYSGGVSVSYIGGTGLFLNFDPGVLPMKRRGGSIAPKAKIIHVSGAENNSACSMEAGVCVIRADR